MKYTYGQALIWLAIYIILSLLPLVFSLVGTTPEPRTFWIEFGVGLGFVGLAMMGMQFLLTGRFRFIASGLGLDNMLQFHRQAGLVATCFILAHPIILLIAEPAFLQFLNPSIYPARAVVLSIASVAIIAIVVTTVWRKTFGIPYEWWRTAHGSLALLIVMVGLIHVMLVGHYIDPLWKRAVWIAFTAGAMGMLIHGRIFRPLVLKKKPWKVVDIREERGNAWTVALEPDGHEGFDFEAGQFAWITIGPSPFSLQQHPFTISSSAESCPRIEFTIKELGDFTSTIKNIPLGTSAFVEGPFGDFSLHDDVCEQGAVFMAGGVGITPVMSMLRTLRDQCRELPLQLFYANNNLDDTIFYDEIQALADEINLDVVFVLADPPPHWDGEEGFLRAEILDKYKTPDNGERRYYVCGPGVMMDVVENLLIDRGIEGRRIFSERFDIV